MRKVQCNTFKEVNFVHTPSSEGAWASIKKLLNHDIRIHQGEFR